MRVLIAVGLILLSWGINAIGIMASEKIQIGMVIQLTSALLILVVIVIVLGKGPDFTQNKPPNVGSFLLASSMAMLSYTGFNIIGEVSRTLALAVRLFGNVMSGAIIGGILLSVIPIIFPTAMDLLGLLTGMIQAYIFPMLAMVYIASATRAREQRDAVAPQEANADSAQEGDAAHGRH